MVAKPNCRRQAKRIISWAQADITMVVIVVVEVVAVVVAVVEAGKVEVSG